MSNENLQRIKAVHKKVFIYDSSPTDEKFFKQRIFDYLKGKAGETLTKTMWQAVWEVNKGETGKYIFLNSNSGNIYLDDDFYEWAKCTCRLMSEELKKAEPKYIAPF